MRIFIFSFCVSFFTCLIIIRLGKQNRAILDFNLGPQKVHIGKIPRIGGVAVEVALITMGIFFLIEKRPNYDLIWKIILCSLPFFIIGLIEDVTKRIKANYRLLFMMLAAILPFYLINARLIRSSIDIVDKALSFWLISLFLTVIAIAGFANAINIIDGLNGLSGVISILFLGGIGYISFKVGDLALFSICNALIGAILGFLVFNYPGGVIFLGDGGAYLIGSIIAMLSILVVIRNDNISPWFPALLLIYPIWETVFSIYRRKWKKKSSSIRADNLHLHTLILKRIVMENNSKNDAKEIVRQNSFASIYVWVFSSWPVVLAVLFWNKTVILIGGAIAFIILYCVFYRSLIKFRTPKWLFLSNKTNRSLNNPE